MYCMSGLRASLRRFRYYRLLCQRRSRWPVGSQVSEFMRQPVSEGVIAHISVAVDEHASAGQVREHGADISGWHVEAKCSGRVNRATNAPYLTRSVRRTGGYVLTH